MLRIGALLYALALAGSYAIPTAVGGNVDRLGALVAGPVAACALGAAARGSRRARALLVLAPLLLYWQANAPVADYSAAASDPAVRASYYAPLLGELRALGVGYGARPARIEVVATVDHWEARFVAPRVMLARGWERQLDRLRNGLFYDQTRLDGARYGDWLAREAVSYVALGDSPLDYSAHEEARLLRGGLVGRAARGLALGALAPVCRRRLPAAGRLAGEARDGHARLLRAARAARRHLHGAAALHALLGADERRRVRVEGTRRLDRDPGVARGSDSRRHPLLARARVQPRSSLRVSMV